VEALLEGGADPDLGTPSAAEAIVLFKLADVWESPFHEAREKLRLERESGEGRCSEKRGDDDGQKH
jgi:hypothetical protein